ncbi:Putative ribonuclease H domain-containing protein [Septoria linicola]|uniref:ribonuclease H n=1 Tax=Septoria linicola TaxID=215465 RepID=A0A9Q9AL87_9PEZI|nr:putative ribonuclease H domain-containing protein [Septoria linicola]USW48505.1 Putative ribonuclease H domain-containing protein [Septoria linicola]
MVYHMVYHIDGACRGNGQPGSIATATAIENLRYGRWKGWTRRLPSFPVPTNQRAELAAIIFALDIILQKHRSLGSRPLINCVIHTDSRYALTCVNEKMFKYAENNWKNSYGNPVANQDLIQTLFGLHHRIAGLGQVRYEWIAKEQNKLANRVCHEDLDKQEAVNAP